MWLEMVQWSMGMIPGDATPRPAADAVRPAPKLHDIFTRRSLPIHLYRAFGLCYHFAMNYPRSLLGASCILLIGATAVLAQDTAKKATEVEPKVAAGPILVKPYLQLGHAQAARQVVLVWHTTDADMAWKVDYRPGTGRRWQTAPAPTFGRVAVAGIEPHRVYHVDLTALEPGQVFGYRVSDDGKAVFQAEGRAPKAADQPHRFVVFGDCGADTPEERAIAFRTFLSKPDFVMITGDIVYGKGLISEYRTKFWPILNADAASPCAGAHSCGRLFFWPRPATTTSPRATWGRLRTASRISITGFSR